MKRISGGLSAFLVILMMVLVLGILPGNVSAAGVKAPTVSISNVAASGKVRLTWNAVKGAVKYAVYRSTDQTGTYSRSITTTETDFTNTGAKAGTRYYYYVRAYAADGTYADSKIVSRTCDLPRPVVTSGNQASSGSPQLTWEAVDGAVSYRVYRATSKNGTYSLMKTTTKTSYLNTSARAGKTYYYKVVAVAERSAANSAESALRYRTCDLPSPVVSVGNAEASGKPRVTWGAVEGATGYQVYRAKSKNGTYTLMKTTKSTSYTNTAAKAGDTYYYKVVALAENSLADSAYSSAKSRLCVLGQPQAAISLNSSGKPRLTWEAVSGAITYQVYRATSPSGTYSLTYTTNGTSYTNVKAVDGNTYYYKVKAFCNNADASSADSKVLSIRTGGEEGWVYVNLPSVYVYQSPTSSSQALKLPYMTELKLGKAISYASGKWYAVYYQGARYYIWITPDSDKLTEKKTTLTYPANNLYQQEIRDLALTIYRQWDTKYVSNESGVVHSDGSVGFDCSGFTCYVINTIMQRYVPSYRLVNETGALWRTDDLYNTGLKGQFRAIDVKLEDAQVGDMVFFKSATTGELNHCGLYMGNGEFLHSTSSWDDGVGLMPLRGTYLDLLIGIKRFVPTEVEPANAAYTVNTSCYLYEDRKCAETRLAVLPKRDPVTVLFATNKPDGSPYTAYVRTADGSYGFTWLKYLTKVE